jgi:hypothetical protein
VKVPLKPVEAGCFIQQVVYWKVNHDWSLR